MVKTCKNCKYGREDYGHYKPYWLWCRKLFSKVRGNADRHKCKHWCE